MCKNIAETPLVDINWLMKLAEHYGCTKDQEWKLFKQQTNEKFRTAGKNENESFIRLSQAENKKMEQMLESLKENE